MPVVRPRPGLSERRALIMALKVDAQNIHDRFLPSLWEVRCTELDGNAFQILMNAWT